jgi:NADH-quinone oxidoreductase subunit M
VILSAVYMLWMFQRVNYGTVTNPKNEKLQDLTTREWAAVLPLVAVAILMGVLPNLFLAPMEPSVKRVVQRMERGAPQHAGRVPLQGDVVLGGAVSAPGADAPAR